MRLATALPAQATQPAPTRAVPEQIDRQDAIIDDLHRRIDSLEQQLAPLFDQVPTPIDNGAHAVEPPRPTQLNHRLQLHNDHLEAAIKRIVMLAEKLHI